MWHKTQRKLFIVAWSFIHRVIYYSDQNVFLVPCEVFHFVSASHSQPKWKLTGCWGVLIKPPLRGGKEKLFDMIHKEVQWVDHKPAFVNPWPWTFNSDDREIYTIFFIISHQLLVFSLLSSVLFDLLQLVLWWPLTYWRHPTVMLMSK